MRQHVMLRTYQLSPKRPSVCLFVHVSVTPQSAIKTEQTRIRKSSL